MVSRAEAAATAILARKISVIIDHTVRPAVAHAIAIVASSIGRRSMLSLVACRLEKVSFFRLERWKISHPGDRRGQKSQAPKKCNARPVGFAKTRSKCGIGFPSHTAYSCKKPGGEKPSIDERKTNVTILDSLTWKIPTSTIVLRAQRICRLCGTQ